MMVNQPHWSVLLTYFRGRVALREVLKALGVGPGDEVAIQAFTCLAVPLPIMSLGATPVYVDVNPDDLGMNVSDLEKKVGPRTRAIVVQHTFGIPADVERVLEVAAKWRIPVVEDCCHVFGATVSGQEVGSFGIAAFYSFEWGKPLVAGLGGGLRVNDPDLLTTLEARHRSLRKPPLLQQAMIESQYLAYRMVLSGRTYWMMREIYHRLSRLGLLVGSFRREDFQGGPNDEYNWTMAPRCEARLRKRLNLVGQLVAHHRRIADRYERGLRALGLNTWQVPQGRQPVYLRYPIRCKNKEAILSFARSKRIELSGIFRTPVHPVELNHAHLVGYVKGACPVAEELCRSLVSVPVGLRVQDRDVDRTLEFIADALSYFLEA